MDKKISFIAKLIIVYVVLLVICFLVYSLVVLPTNGAEKVNAIIGLLSWSATIFAPIAAFFLLDNWKEQKRFELKKEYIALTLHDLRKLNSNLINMLTQISNIESTEYKLVIVSSYLDSERLSNINLIHNIYSNLKVYSHLSNHTEIDEIFYGFEQHNYFVEIYYKEVIKRYFNYFNQFTKDRLSANVNNIGNLDINRAYVGNESDSIKNHVIYIKEYISKPQKYQRTAEPKDYVLTYKYKELFQNTKVLYERIHEICLKEFNL